MLRVNFKESEFSFRGYLEHRRVGAVGCVVLMEVWMLERISCNGV